jgi:alcohol dehydrogenase
MDFKAYVPTKALFGCGQLAHLSEQALPGDKAMIIVSNGRSVKNNGYLARTAEQLHKAGVQTFLFDQVEANPLKSTVMAGSAAARRYGCDFLVALGGGSCIDAAKAIAVMAKNSGDLWDYISVGTGKGKPIKVNPLPLIAIVTTAGTGSETDMGGVITNAATNEKTPIKHEKLFPVLSVIDPELMVTVPPRLTALQGFDALFHNVEGYISKKASFMSDMVALTAIEHIGRHLADAVRNGHDLDAREHVAFGSYLGGIEMVVCSTSSQHSLEHAMSAYHQELPHGAGLIMLSQDYFSYFIEHHACDDRFVRIAQALGMENASQPKDFLTALAKLQEDCGVADLKMSDYGIVPEEFHKMAENAKSAMGFLFQSDRLDLSIDDVVAIYQRAFK